MQRAVASKALPRARVVFSGIQPTGVPHLGNYVGALRQWLRLQHQEKPDTKLIYSIVDLHAITVPQNPERLRRHKREALAALLAIGIDPDRCTLFYQSSVGDPRFNHSLAHPLTCFLESVAPSFLRLTLAGGRSRRTRSSCGFSPARHPSVTYRG